MEIFILCKWSHVPFQLHNNQYIFNKYSNIILTHTYCLIYLVIYLLINYIIAIYHPTIVKKREHMRPTQFTP